MRLYHGTSLFAALIVVKQGYIKDPASKEHKSKVGNISVGGFTYFTNNIGFAAGIASTPIEGSRLYGQLTGRGLPKKMALFLSSSALLVTDIDDDLLYVDPEEVVEDDSGIAMEAYRNPAYKKKVIAFAVKNLGIDISEMSSNTLKATIDDWEGHSERFELRAFMLNNLPPSQRKKLLSGHELFMVKGKVPIKQAYYAGSYEDPGEFDVNSEAEAKSQGTLLTKQRVERILTAMRKSAGR